MSKIVSIHEYVLKPNVDLDHFERVIKDAEDKGVLALPGLDSITFVKGIRGDRHNHYAVIWIYETEEAWAYLWGPVDQPRVKNDYPPPWKIWEDEILAPFLDRDPDKITFTTYKEI
jgi:hypothetical protein